MPPEFWYFLAVAAVVFGRIVGVVVRAITEVIRDLIKRQCR